MSMRNYLPEDGRLRRARENDSAITQIAIIFMLVVFLLGFGLGVAVR